MTWRSGEAGVSIYLSVVAIIFTFFSLLFLCCCDIYRKDILDNEDLTPGAQIKADAQKCIACLTCKICRKDNTVGNKPFDSHEYETPGDGSDDENDKY